MLEKALKYLVGLDVPHLVEKDGATFCDKALSRVTPEQYANGFTLSTLSSLVEYIKAGADTMKGHMFVHVESPTEISVFSQLDNNRKREKVVCVEAELPTIKTNTYVGREEFNIALQSKFVDNEDKALLLTFVGAVENGTVQEYGDDGVSQKATIRTGIASKGEALVPNPVRLMPYRTFTEVAQPESAFVFRMRSDRGVECALYEADGGAWRLEAMENIKAYLKMELADVEGYTVIS